MKYERRISERFQCICYELIIIAKRQAVWTTKTHSNERSGWHIFYCIVCGEQNVRFMLYKRFHENICVSFIFKACSSSRVIPSLFHCVHMVDVSFVPLYLRIGRIILWATYIYNNCWSNICTCKPSTLYSIVMFLFPLPFNAIGRAYNRRNAYHLFHYLTSFTISNVIMMGLCSGQIILIDF